MRKNRHADSDCLSTVEEHLAFTRMRRKRTCPGIAALKKGGEAIRLHLEICGHCRQELEFFRDAPDFSGILPSAAKSPAALPAAGQIRQVREEAGSGRTGDGFFRAPVVVVTQVPAGQADFVRVAQIHDEPELRGSGDIAVKFPDGVKFVESWNTYPMLTRFLGPVIGTMAKSAVGRVLAEEKKADSGTGGNPVLRTFRTLEVDVASHFCEKSVAEIQEKLEGGEDSQESSKPFQSAGGADAAGVTPSSGPILRECAENWDDLIEPLPLAASEAVICPDDGADRVMENRPCLLLAGGERKTIPVEVRIHELDRAVACFACCRFPEAPAHAEGLISLERDERVTETEILPGGVVRMMARIECENLQVEKLRLVLAVTWR